MEWFQDVFAFEGDFADLNALAGSVPDSAGAALFRLLPAWMECLFEIQEDALPLWDFRAELSVLI